MNDATLRTDFLTATSRNIGAVPAASVSTITATEFGDHLLHQTLLTYNAFPVVTGNTTGASFGSKQVYDFPAGRVAIISNLAYFTQITFNTEAGTNGDIAGAGSGDYSMGSTATADATLATTDVDLLPSTAMLDPFVTGVGRSNVGSALAALVQFDGTTTPLDMYLNVIIDDADVSDGAANDSVYFTGWSRTTWLWLGDY